MNWRRWINKDNETLFDLIFGCIVYSIVFEVIGLLVVENKGSYSMGLLLGTAVAVGLSVSMYKGLNRCLVMTEQVWHLAHFSDQRLYCWLHGSECAQDILVFRESSLESLG